MTLIHRYGAWLACVALLVFGLGMPCADAQSSYPLYCQGPHETSAPSPAASFGVGRGSGDGRRDFDVTKIVSTLLHEHLWNESELSVTFNVDLV
jgi:hypothetical protein